MLTITAVALLVSGCVEAERRYVNENVSQNIIILKHDRFELSDKGSVWVGEYTENESSITLIMSPPFPSIKLKKSGRNLIYEYGKKTAVFVPQPQMG